MTGPAPAGTRRPAPPADVATYGETMIRYRFPPSTWLGDVHEVRVDPGGAESNVAVALASLGRRVRWGSALPDGVFGRFVRTRLAGSGVDLDFVADVPGARLGAYGYDAALPPRTPSVTYDRSGSAFAEHDPDDDDVDRLVHGARHLHLTGITPAIGPRPRRAFRRLLAAAGRHGASVSLDVNHRDRLWSDDDARTVLEPVLPQVDLLLCGRRDAVRLFGAPADDPDGTGALEAIQGAGAAKHVVVTLGADGAVARAPDGTVRREPARPVRIVDRPGAGDAFAAGVLDGMLDHDLARGLRQGTVLAALALSHHGDAVRPDRTELDALLRDASSPERANGGLAR